MNNEEIVASIKDLQKGSKQSLGMVLVGVIFLASSITYSFIRLQPLQQQVTELKDLISQLEAKKAELSGFAAAADAAAKPATIPASAPEMVGWIYLGLISSSDNWISKSDRVDTKDQPSALVSGAGLTTKQNTSLVEDPSAVEQDASRTAERKITPSFFVKPNSTVSVLETLQQNTIGSGKLIWAKVRVKSTDLLQVRG